MAEFRCDIYITGVGGQGIGLLSETLLRAYDHAGFPVTGVDTHGLAQRGGVVVSHLRVGDTNFSPLIEPGGADIVIALERTEALRGLITYAKKGSTLIYYDLSWQPLPVRLKKRESVTNEMVQDAAVLQDVRIIAVDNPDLPDPRMQNMALLSYALQQHALPNLKTDHIHSALEDLLAGTVLKQNLSLF